MIKVISICNQKGGVGKTTTSINLAASLAAAEKRTLLVDMDPQGNTTSGVAIDKHAVEQSIYDVLIGNANLEDVAVQTELSYLKVVPANVHLVGAELELAATVSRETKLLAAISKVRDSYDYILIDCPPSLGLLTINALTASDGVLIPVQSEYYALEGMTDLLRTVELVKQSLNPELELVGILLTMFDKRNNLARQVSDEIYKHFKEKVFNTVVPRNVRLSEAPSHGRPILLYDIKSIGAASYLELANEVILRTPTVLEKQSSQGVENDERSPSHAGTQSVGQGVVVTDTQHASTEREPSH